jgi:hypothetical protein
MEPDANGGVQTPAPRRQVELTRRTCIITPDSISIRPSPSALLPPLFGMSLGAICFALIIADVVRWRGALPFWLLAVLLVAALILIPLSGMGLVYGAIGSSVLIDRAKNSVTWQQGLLGLGVGTRELVPFWRIEAIVVAEEGAAEGRTTEEFAQWEIALVKKNGGRLTIGRVSAPRSLAEPSQGRAVEVARAIADLTAAPLRIER